jgi:hypothetical protein
MAQKIDIKVEQAFVGRKELYFCLYVDDQFISCPWMVTDIDKAGCKKWLKETMSVKKIQDKLYYAKQIKDGSYTVWKDGTVSKTPN